VNLRILGQPCEFYLQHEEPEHHAQRRQPARVQDVRLWQQAPPAHARARPRRPPRGCVEAALAGWMGRGTRLPAASVGLDGTAGRPGAEANEGRRGGQALKLGAEVGAEAGGRPAQPAEEEQVE
jgi:hypothetical protein